MDKSYERYSILSVAICSLLYGQIAFADDYFNPNLIEGMSKKTVDLTVFNQVGGQAEGTYLTEVYLNNNYIVDQKIPYEHQNSSNTLVPILTKEEYIKFGVSPNALPAFMALPDNQIIKNIADIIPDAFVKYDFAQNRLDISIPQKYVSSIARGTVSPDKWDDGLTTLFTNYTYSGSSTDIDGRSGTDQSSYLNLRSGLNIGAWRVRNYSTYSHSNHQDTWQNISTYAERDIKPIRGRLTIGDSYTPSEMFDSFSYRGVRVASDDAMLPESQRGFAPVVRGIASSNAQVTVRQNGNIIWQSYVSPGPFVISDLYPGASSGDLEVSIKESDGSVRTFIQPFSAVPIMLREGGFKYSVTAGQYRNNSQEDKTPNFIQATAIYGISNHTTAYSGAIFSSGYNSLLLGVGQSLGELGSISLDVTAANVKLEEGNQVTNHSGASLRFQYSKEVLSTGTSFALAGYRYSTSKYLDFSEANGSYSYLSSDTSGANYSRWNSRLNKRSKLQISMNQRLGDYGTVYLSGYQQQYWNTSNKEQSLNIGYSQNYKGISYNLNYSYTKNTYSKRSDQNFYFSVQIPFDIFTSSSSNAWITASMNADRDGNNTSLIGISGTALEDNNLSYSVQEGYSNRGQGSTGNATVNYRAGFGQYQLGYNYTKNTKQWNYSAMGGILVHPYGVTLSQPLGDTMVLVRAKDASNVRINNNPGVRTDYFGNAVVPYVTPYRQNDITLDSATLGQHAELLTTTKTVVPTKGALVMAEYPTQIGYKVFVTLTGFTIPFGAKASVVNNGVTLEGIVDDKQNVYLSGVPAEGIINVTWSDGQCSAPFKLTNTDATVISLSAACNQ